MRMQSYSRMARKELAAVLSELRGGGAGERGEPCLDEEGLDRPPPSFRDLDGYVAEHSDATAEGSLSEATD